MVHLLSEWRLEPPGDAAGSCGVELKAPFALSADGTNEDEE